MDSPHVLCTTIAGSIRLAARSRATWSLRTSFRRKETHRPSFRSLLLEHLGKAPCRGKENPAEAGLQVREDHCLARQVRHMRHALVLISFACFTVRHGRRQDLLSLP